jgi:hypothetical protein
MQSEATMATPSSDENSPAASPICFKLPEGAKVRGAVYRTKHPDYVTEDPPVPCDPKWK